MPRLPGGKDVITQPLYDSASFVTASTLRLNFFNTPLGAGTTVWGGAGTKTLVDTNMSLAGQLPSPWTFTIMTLQVQFAPNIGGADLKGILNACSLELIIGAKNWMQIPAVLLAAGAGPDGSGTDINHNGIADPRAVFALSRPIELLENENFNVSMVWNAVVTLVATPQPIRVLFGGELSRGIQ